MFVAYDEAAVAAAEIRVPAFQPGWYAARATGFTEAAAYGQGGKKLVVDFEVWQEEQRDAARRTVKGHFCLHHPQPQARGMAHARLRDLGQATGCFVPGGGGQAGGTNVPAVVGKWLRVELTLHNGKNQKGEPMTFNHINGYEPLSKGAPTGPEAPGAGLPPQQATAQQYRDASQGFDDAAGPDVPPADGGIDDMDGVPF